MEAMNEMIQDTMDVDEGEIDDADVDKLILGMEDEVRKKKMQEQEFDELQGEEAL